MTNPANAVPLSVITGLLSGLVSAALTYLGTRSKVRLDMTVEYDKSLREKRLELYRQLWPKTEPLGRFDPASRLTVEVIRAVSTDLHDWYFCEGGLYLSKASRVPYFELKARMHEVLDRESPNQEQQIDVEARRLILDAASRLRTSLADDIRTRRAPWL